MSKAKTFLKFIRIQQYYKNAIIFLPIIFSLHLFSKEDFLVTIAGFVSLCLISSALYIRNDILDVELDKVHPRKSKRALPSGLITLNQSWLIFTIFILVGFTISFFLNWKFTVMLLLLFLNTEIYSRWTKNIIFLDAFAIGGNFIIRAISGIILIESKVSPWLILGVFFVALFLGYIKRMAETESLNDNAGNHRKTLEDYTPFSLNAVVMISAMMIIITYSLYAIEGPQQDWRLVLTVPIIVFVIFRQLYLVSVNDTIAQTNEVFRDKQSAVAIVIFLVSTIYLMYFVPTSFFK